MPAKSTSQQHLMGMVYRYKQTGELPSNVRLAKKIKDIAKGITKSSAKDFAKTKHKGLPGHVSEHATFKEFLSQYIAEGEVVPFPKAKKQSIDDLLNAKISGRFGDQDADLWGKLETFIMNDKNPMDLRIKALKKIDEIIGNAQNSYSEKDVDEYVKQTHQMRD